MIWFGIWGVISKHAPNGLVNELVKASGSVLYMLSIFRMNRDPSPILEFV